MSHEYDLFSGISYPYLFALSMEFIPWNFFHIPYIKSARDKILALRVSTIVLV